MCSLDAEPLQIQNRPPVADVGRISAGGQSSTWWWQQLQTAGAEEPRSNSPCPSTDLSFIDELLDSSLSTDAEGGSGSDAEGGWGTGSSDSAELSLTEIAIEQLIKC